MIFSKLKTLTMKEKLGFLIGLVAIYLFTGVAFKTVREKLENINTSSATTSTTCPTECVKPKLLGNTCAKTLYKDPTTPNKCYKRCPYECPSTLDKCKISDYCSNCGYDKIDAPCDGSEIVEPVPASDPSTALNSQPKATTLENAVKIKEEKNKYEIEVVDGNVNVYFLNGSDGLNSLTGQLRPQAPYQSLFGDSTAPFSPFINQFTQT